MKQTVNDHPMQPPPELVRRWLDEAVNDSQTLIDCAYRIARPAYAAGADAELDECEKWGNEYRNGLGQKLRSARRPKPPSLKQQALELMQTHGAAALKLNPSQCETIRQALEQLPDD